MRRQAIGATVFCGADRLYGTTEKRFSVVECSGCRLLRMHPWPSAGELQKYYPDTYWFSPQDGTVSHLEEMYRRLVLRDHVNFVASACKPAEVRSWTWAAGRTVRTACWPTADIGFSGWTFLIRLRAWLGVRTACRSSPGSSPMRHFPAIHSQRSRCFMSWSILRSVCLHPGGVASSEARRAAGVQVPNAASWQFLLFGEHWNGLDIPRHLINFRASDIQAIARAK